MSKEKRIAQALDNIRAMMEASDAELSRFEKLIAENERQLTASLSAEQLVICKITGRSPIETARFDARERADKAVVSRLLPVQRKILEVTVGSDVPSMARAARANGWAA